MENGIHWTMIVGDVVSGWLVLSSKFLFVCLTCLYCAFRIHQTFVWGNSSVSTNMTWGRIRVGALQTLIRERIETSWKNLLLLISSSIIIVHSPEKNSENTLLVAPSQRTYASFLQPIIFWSGSAFITPPHRLWQRTHWPPKKCWSLDRDSDVFFDSLSKLNVYI